MAKRLNESLWKKYCEDKRNSEFGLDALKDGSTALQRVNQHFIGRNFSVIDVLDEYFIDTYLVMVAFCKCRRLLRFSICPQGLYTVKTIPVFGGNNTPVTFNLTVKQNIQLKCLELNPLPTKSQKKRIA